MIVYLYSYEHCVYLRVKIELDTIKQLASAIREQTILAVQLTTPAWLQLLLEHHIFFLNQLSPEVCRESTQSLDMPLEVLPETDDRIMATNIVPLISITAASQDPTGCEKCT
ncbi:hypothetical protein PoB_000008700 [Plakobranchus ocellatus]|uniref:Uncharacterized protein n=1 Tax=Plakobranchus ocellatus TaxID=259542 RepID=A0AAV3XUM3_9GAST|nr:hypothetical protein PoB_000008700 [Plakobranchus ocellatus]